jgi:hypothetical protein
MHFKDSEVLCEKNHKTVTCPAENERSKRDKYKI